jgi:hypothetical protein
MVFSTKRTSLWNVFYSDLVATKKVDGKKFWEFREFYSPGHFVYKRDGFAKEEVEKNLTKLGITKSIGDEHFFLLYSSNRIKSIESLSTIRTLDEVLKTYDIKRDNSLLQGDNFFLWEENDKKVFLIFLLDNNEMMRANGFFDYAEEDKELVEGKKWLVFTLILLD